MAPVCQAACYMAALHQPQPQQLPAIPQSPDLGRQKVRLGSGLLSGPGAPSQGCGFSMQGQGRAYRGPSQGGAGSRVQDQGCRVGQGEIPSSGAQGPPPAVGRAKGAGLPACWVQGWDPCLLWVRAHWLGRAACASARGSHPTCWGVSCRKQLSGKWGSSGRTARRKLRGHVGTAPRKGACSRRLAKAAFCPRVRWAL